jgi:hypothetical protein
MAQDSLYPLRMLATDWLKRLLVAESGADFKQQGTGKDCLTFGVPGESVVEGRFIDSPPFISFHKEVPALKPLIDRLGSTACENARRGLVGDVLWYTTEFTAPGLTPSFTRNMFSFVFEFLTAQTRILGWRRIGLDVLLEFNEEQSEAGGHSSPFAPPAKVAVHLAARGPTQGFFATNIAHHLAETAAAICAFALGRPVMGGAFVVPSKPEVLSELQAKHRDPAVLTLARKRVSLDIFSTVAGAPELDHIHRLRAALRTYNWALAQDNDEVARILYVVAMESLCSPRTSWKTQRMSRRFLDFFDDLMPQAIDEVVAHANFEEAFQINRGQRTARALRRDLLQHVYSLRSEPVHQGLSPHFHALGMAYKDSASLQRGFFCNLSEKAILAYLQAPGSSLVGHPRLDALASSAE